MAVRNPRRAAAAPAKPRRAGAATGARKKKAPAFQARRVSAAELRAMIGDGAELALLDVREEGAFAASHLLLAAPLPLSQLELRLADLVPRRGTRVVLTDAGEGLADRAAERMAGFGYTDVAVLDGGTEGWKAAGFELFSGFNVPSKAFGEFVEHAYGTPSIDADELKAMMDAGQKLVVLDSRPMDEYHAMNIPTGVCCPGAELVYRVHDLAPSPDTTVVVNCAGRTRSIIGAQSLINAGIPNRVVALRNGTMGWHLAGQVLEHGSTRMAGGPSPQGLAAAKTAAERVRRRFGVRTIDRATLAEWRAEAEERSLYVIDVRHGEEYEAGHLPGSIHAPGGQLVQATDRYVGTRGARIVLVDDTLVRASLTASWLVQMGWDAVVLEGGIGRDVSEAGPRRGPILGLAAAPPYGIAPITLRALMDRGGTAVIDLADSRSYRKDGHIPGAWFAVRSRLAAAIKAIGKAERYVLTSPDGVLARLAVADLRALTTKPAEALAGGTAAWRRAGGALETGEERLADTPDDVWLKPYERAGTVEDAMREYLSWEIDLVHQIERDGTARFKTFPAA